MDNIKRKQVFRNLFIFINENLPSELGYDEEGQINSVTLDNGECMSIISSEENGKIIKNLSIKGETLTHFMLECFNSKS